ncbi:MAG: RHS repeat-associated core domain-containing protein [Chloroflexota bacterium]
MTQVLSDGTTNYAYGMGRISQQQGSTTEYFLGDALGSVRQMTNQTGAITFAQTYDPYGAVTHSSGLSSHTDYGFTGESYSPSTQLTYLRARYYNPADGRFTSRDTWGGDVNRPLSLNRWGYVEGNPVNLTDPSGHDSAWENCTERNNPVCMEKVRQLKKRGVSIREMVRTGTLLPVEGLAQYIDYAQTLFNSNMRGMTWALTLTINGMDANRGWVWRQTNVPYRGNWLDYDWLPYKNNSTYNVQNWLDRGTREWIHSRRGDWRIEYWDKTANQAFHFMYFTAVTFFDGRGWAELANLVHEQNRKEIVFFPEWIPSPQSGSTEQDNNLSFAAFDFGDVLLRNDDIYRTYYDALCATDTNLSLLFNHVAYIKPSAWIRANLKGLVR